MQFLNLFNITFMRHVGNCSLQSLCEWEVGESHVVVIRLKTGSPVVWSEISDHLKTWFCTNYIIRMFTNRYRSDQHRHHAVYQTCGIYLYVSWYQPATFLITIIVDVHTFIFTVQYCTCFLRSAKKLRTYFNRKSKEGLYHFFMTAWKKCTAMFALSDSNSKFTWFLIDTNSSITDWLMQPVLHNTVRHSQKLRT